MKKLIILAILVINISILPVYPYDRDELTNINVYEKINPAIVAIDAKVSDGTSSGSGCIVNADGVILTSSHVILNSDNIRVTTSDGVSYKAQVIKKLGNDLTLLKISAEKPLKTITLGNSSTVKVGQKVLAIGNPFGFSGTLTQGIVSRIDTKRNKIQTDAAINPGSSGGPLLNTSGEVIGINQAIYNPDNNTSNIGIGFAIPINEARGKCGFSVE
ncbi:MAG: trypsin-like peptidase domain-containing protein [Cyanobacteria bacterium RUI128]|nr:trypsin-like peptidase domain-containing protein [Cyanobacteria bacterium RUI128]